MSTGAGFSLLFFNAKNSQKKGRSPIKTTKALTPEAFQCPMRWDDFITLPREAQKLYISTLKERFAPTEKALAEMFRVSRQKLVPHFKKFGIDRVYTVPTEAQLEAWQSFATRDPKEAHHWMLYDRVLHLREKGLTYNEVARLSRTFSETHCAKICRIYHMIAEGKFVELVNNPCNFAKNIGIIRWAATAQGKDADKVLERIKEYQRTEAEQKIREVAECDPVVPEEVPDSEFVSVVSPKLLQVLSALNPDMLSQLNENLTFFRNLLSGSLQVS